MGCYLNTLSMAGIGKIPLERPVHDQDVKSTEAGHRPGTDRIEKGARHEIDGGDQSHHYDETPTRKRPMGRQRCRPAYGIVSFHIVI